MPYAGATEPPTEEAPGGSTSATSRITYGDPTNVSFRELERTDRYVVLELVTGGFYAVVQEDGSVELSVPNVPDSLRPLERRLRARETDAPQCVRASPSGLAGREIGAVGRVVYRRASADDPDLEIVSAFGHAILEVPRRSSIDHVQSDECIGCRSGIYNSINNLQVHYRWYVTHCL